MAKSQLVVETPDSWNPRYWYGCRTFPDTYNGQRAAARYAKNMAKRHVTGKARIVRTSRSITTRVALTVK